MNTIFFSSWGKEKVIKSRMFFFQQGEKICLVLLEKFKAQERREQKIFQMSSECAKRRE